MNGGSGEDDEDDSDVKYRIERCFASGEPRRETVETGLSLDEARDHCNSPEASSRTCTSKEGEKRTRERGAWFDAYYEEDDD